MAINIHSTRALRGISDPQQLVKAIVAAEEHDEADWVGWKSTLDLAKEGCIPAPKQYWEWRTGCQSQLP